MTVRGIEAIKLHLPPTNEQIDTNVKEEIGFDSELKAETRPIMNSVGRYRQEWEQLLKDIQENPERVKNLAFIGDLKISKFRSIYWAILLHVLNFNSDKWKGQREQQRQRYEKLKQEFAKNPREIEVPNDDPLSQSTQSVWNQYFSDQELYNVIGQDVTRTFPGVDFFRKTTVQTDMTNILFYYAREHPYLCYRQGMHEILAPIIFVLYSDHQSLLHFKEIETMEIDEILLNVLDPNYFEADCYTMFSRLMSLIGPYYHVTNVVQTQGGHISVATDNTMMFPTEIEVVQHLNFIRDKILAKEDLHLHNYLLKLDIPLHIFGIKWLRLLFGREFPLLDLLILWDAIFADSDHFDLPNYILVAMLIHIRNQLLLSDYNTCLTYLMRYPGNINVNLILQHALHMCMPKKFDRPENVFVYLTMQPDSSSSTRAVRLHSISRREMEINSQQKQITTGPAVRADNNSENSPELLQLKLKNAQTVITIARAKLQSYLKTARKHITKNSHPKELTQALDGIEDLCGFLDIKTTLPIHTNKMSIDLALEANESKMSPQQVKRGISMGDNQVGSDKAVSPDKSSEKRTSYEKPDNGFIFSSRPSLRNLKEIELLPITTDEEMVHPTSSMPIVDPLRHCKKQS